MIIFNKNEKLPSNNIGLGYLNNVITATVTEEINGIYVLDFISLQDEKIKIGNIVKCKVAIDRWYYDNNIKYELQYFRISTIIQNSDNTVEVSANHLSYDLSKIIVLPKSYEGTPSEILGEMMYYSLNGKYYDFMFSNGVNSYNIINVSKPTNLKEILMGKSESMSNVFNVEYLFNNFLINVTKRGIDSEVCFYYGTGINEITAETNNDNEYKGIVPYAIIDDVLKLIPQKFVGENKTLKAVDYSDKFDEYNPFDESKLIYYASRDLKNCIVKNNVSISFNELENDNLNILCLGDYIKVKYKNPDINLKARIVKTVYDVLKNKIIEIEIGYLKDLKIGGV